MECGSSLPPIHTLPIHTPPLHNNDNNNYFSSSLNNNMKSILDTAEEIACAMSQLCSQGIIHGDLKPANILLHTSKDSNRGWIAKVADFGTSRILGHKVQDVKLGTLPYMPPEIIGDGKFNNHDYNGIYFHI